MLLESVQHFLQVSFYFNYFSALKKQKTSDDESSEAVKFYSIIVQLLLLVAVIKKFSFTHSITFFFMYRKERVLKLRG